MDKVVRNVIIFSAIVLLVAAIFTVLIVSKRDSPNDATKDTNVLPTTSTVVSGEVQDATLSVVGATYVITPSTLKKGIPVRMTADIATFKGCSRSVVIASLGVRKYLTPGDNVIMFTPTTAGTVRIACSMNMYIGSFTVV